MILVVTEKNDTARRISEILAEGAVKKEALQKVNVYRFKRDGEEYTCLGLRGHILNFDYPEEFKDWKRDAIRSLIDAPIERKASLKSFVSVLKKEAKGADEVIIATDYDREGEVIGYEAIEIIEGTKKGLPMRRVHYSTLTKKEITDAFAHQTEPYWNLAQAGEARQRIDLIWGAVLTRYISLAANRRGQNFLSVGRVQTPTLALLVEREEEIEAFVPEEYWQLFATFRAADGEFRALHIADRFTDKALAESAQARLTPPGRVTAVKRTSRRTAPPTPFDTTAFLSAASGIGIKPASAMRTAESLYMNGYISYPRTDNTTYPEQMDLPGILGMFAGHAEFGAQAGELLAQGELKPTRGKKKTTDHPPIYPTEPVPRARLNEYDWKVYELIVRRFMATLAPESRSEGVRIDAALGGEGFFARGSRVVEEGWLAYYPYLRRKDEELPDVKEGEELDLVAVELEEKETKPPARYSQGKLIETMEKSGLGTKATRHNIIQNLYDRGYIIADPIKVRPVGMAVIKALKRHASAITSPDMTAALEADMDLISEGKKEMPGVVDSSRRSLEGIYDLMEKDREEIAKEIKEGVWAEVILGKCPQCGNDMRQLTARASKKRFVGCKGYPECRQTYPLPQFGEILPLDESCKECGSPRIRVLVAKKRPWETCLDMSCPTKKDRIAKKVPEGEERS